MLKNLSLISFILLTACSCKQVDKNTDGKTIKSETEQTDTIARVETSKKDSLRNPYHYAYLTDLSSEEIGMLMLKAEIKPMDNAVTFKLMDTVLNCKLEDLGFYMSVFESIMQKSDGAISEAIGQYTLGFMKSRPKVFVNHLDTSRPENIINWAEYTVYEMHFDFPEDSLVYQCQALVKEFGELKKNKGLKLLEESMLSSAKVMLE
jgi:hypothetical protein